MEARMLSLFDDEDFLPQEKPKSVKPKKSLAKKEGVKPETEEDNGDKELPEAATNEAQAVCSYRNPGSYARRPARNRRGGAVCAGRTG